MTHQCHSETFLSFNASFWVHVELWLKIKNKLEVKITCNICVSTFPSVCVCVSVCAFVFGCGRVDVCMSGGEDITSVMLIRVGREGHPERDHIQSSFSIYMSTTFALCLCRWRHHSCHVEQSRGSTCMWPNYCGCFWLWWKLRAPRGLSTFSDQCMKEQTTECFTLRKRAAFSKVMEL